MRRQRFDTVAGERQRLKGEATVVELVEVYKSKITKDRVNVKRKGVNGDDFLIEKRRRKVRLSRRAGGFWRRARQRDTTIVKKIEREREKRTLLKRAKQTARLVAARRPTWRPLFAHAQFGLDIQTISIYRSKPGDSCHPTS